MDPRTQLAEILPLLKALVAPLKEEQLDTPTACESFAVRNVLEHMVGGATIFSAVFRGQEPTEGDLPTDLVAAFPFAMDELEAGINSPGALERVIASPIGDVPGEMFARFVAIDGLVHGWDLATATGQEYDPPATIVAEVAAFAQQAITAEVRERGLFAAATEAPVGASPLEQLVAFTGRTV